MKYLIPKLRFKMAMGIAALHRKLFRVTRNFPAVTKNASRPPPRLGVAETRGVSKLFFNEASATIQYCIWLKLLSIAVR
jgi:hypothetical protein